MTNYWIFPFRTVINANAKSKILSATSEFLSNWESHGARIEAGAEILYFQILFIYLEDQGEAGSGCSIDALKREIKNILALENIEIVDSNYIVLKLDDGLRFIKRSEISSRFSIGEIPLESKLLDLSIKFDPLKGYEQLFIPIEGSWLYSYCTNFDH